MRERLLSPYSDATDITQRLNEVQDFMSWDELRGWLERNELPHSYSFDQNNYETPLVMSHEHDAHAIAHGGGA